MVCGHEHAPDAQVGPDEHDEGNSEQRRHDATPRGAPPIRRMPWKRLLMALTELPQIMEVARVIAGERPVQLVDNVGGRSHLLVHVGACDPDVAVLHALNCDNSAFFAYEVVQGGNRFVDGAVVDDDVASFAVA